MLGTFCVPILEMHNKQSLCAGTQLHLKHTKFYLVWIRRDESRLFQWG